MKSHVVCMPVEQCTLCFAVICMKSFNTKERNFISSRKCLKWNCSIYYKYLLRQNLYYVIQICAVQIYSIQNISLVEINNLLQMYFEEIYCHGSLLVVFFSDSKSNVIGRILQELALMFCCEGNKLLSLKLWTFSIQLLPFVSLFFLNFKGFSFVFVARIQYYFWWNKNIKKNSWGYHWLCKLIVSWICCFSAK